MNRCSRLNHTLLLFLNSCCWSWGSWCGLFINLKNYQQTCFWFICGTFTTTELFGKRFLSVVQFQSWNLPHRASVIYENFLWVYTFWCVCVPVTWCQLSGVFESKFMLCLGQDTNYYNSLWCKWYQSQGHGFVISARMTDEAQVF